MTTPVDPLAFDDQVVDRLLEQVEIRLRLQRIAHRGLVQHPVGLRAGRPHRRALARVQGTKLDTAKIGGVRHQPTQGIDLAYQVTLADTADRRIAAHRAEGLDAVRQQQGTHAHARSRQRGLGAGMAAADHDHVIAVCMEHRITL